MAGAEERTEGGLRERIEVAGQSILVTGAAQGLGAAIARHLHGRGADLTLLDRDADGLGETVGACPGAVAAVVDLADAEALTATLDNVLTGPIDTLVHNAVLLRFEPLEAVTLEAFQTTLNVGIQGAFQLTRAVWPAMTSRGGSLVFVSSRSGIEGFANEAPYCPAKHTIEGFAKSLALEGEPHGILSVTVTPGMYMRTPMSERNYPPELKEKWVDPMELAPALSYLATRPLHLTGQRLSAWDLSQEHPAP